MLQGFLDEIVQLVDGYVWHTVRMLVPIALSFNLLYHQPRSFQTQGGIFAVIIPEVALYSV